MFRRSIAYVLFVAFLVCNSATTHADWSRFRGPNGSGLSPDNNPMPVTWSASENLKWKVVLPGSGTSSPIIVGNRIYVTTYSGYGLDRESPGNQEDLKRHLVCIDRNNGKLIWEKTVDAVLPEDPYTGIGVPEHGYASNTPVSDGERVYVFFGKTGALAFDRDGKQLWQTSVGKESDPRRWGSASSPILFKNLLIVPATAESEALIALDTRTGKEVWRQEAAGLSMSWCTPILVKVDADRTDLVIGVAREIWGLNPETGKLRWYSKGVNGDSFYSSVVSHDGIVYAIEGREGGSLAVRAGGKGDVTKSHVLWTGRHTNRIGTPLVYEGRVYLVANGITTSIDAKTGEKAAEARLKGGRPAPQERRMGGDYASPIIADGKLYFMTHSGDMFVLKPNDELEQLAVNRVTAEQEEFSATPAAVNGELYFRSNKHLYCVASTGKTTPDASPTPRPKPGQDASTTAAADAPEPRTHGANRPGHPMPEGGTGGPGGPGGRAGRGHGGRGDGGFDPSMMFKRRDANGDGKLSGDEIPGRMRGRIDRLDTDKDGAITLQEFRSGMGGMRGGRGHGGSRGNPREGKPERPQRPELEP